jgi:uncharacterized phiE125 gp8 family phage protein
MVLETGHFPFGHFPSGAFPDGHWPLLPIFPVSLDDVKKQLRFDYDDDDSLITSLILAAVCWAEHFQRRLFISRICFDYLDSFPGVIRPVWSNLVAIDSIKYLDISEMLQILDSSIYQVDIETQPGRIIPAYGQSWPATFAATNAVIINYTAGYGVAADVPDDIKSAIIMITQYFYERCRNHVMFEAAKRLLWKKRLVSV